MFDAVVAFAVIAEIETTVEDESGRSRSESESESESEESEESELDEEDVLIDENNELVDDGDNSLCMLLNFVVGNTVCGVVWELCKFSSVPFSSVHKGVPSRDGSFFGRSTFCMADARRDRRLDARNLTLGGPLLLLRTAPVMLLGPTGGHRLCRLGLDARELKFVLESDTHGLVSKERMPG